MPNGGLSLIFNSLLGNIKIPIISIISMATPAEGAPTNRREQYELMKLYLKDGQIDLNTQGIIG